MNDYESNKNICLCTQKERGDREKVKARVTGKKKYWEEKKNWGNKFAHISIEPFMVRTFHPQPRRNGYLKWYHPMSTSVSVCKWRRKHLRISGWVNHQRQRKWDLFGCYIKITRGKIFFLWHASVGVIFFFHSELKPSDAFWVLPLSFNKTQMIWRRSVQ